MVQNPEWGRLHARIQRRCLHVFYQHQPCPHRRSPLTLHGWNFSDLSSPVLQGVHTTCFQARTAIPLVYFLLPGKRREAYNTSFILLKEAAQNIGIEVDPQRVLTDLELALQQSVAICFPQAERKGCLFHYTQAIWRKVQNLGLQRLYKEDDEFRCFVNSVIALAFVQPMFVRVAWRGEAPVFPNRDDFFEYFQRTWVDGNFPISMWNVYSLDGPRTNNNAKGWHSKVRKLAGKAHPNIY